MEKRFFVYITATRKDGPIYVGVTSDLPKRATQKDNPEWRDLYFDIALP